MARELTDSESGKEIVTPDGDPVGTVASVRDGTAYVDPDPEAPETVVATLGWDDLDGDDGYPLPRTAVDEVTPETIRLRRGDDDVDRDEVDHDRDVELARERDAERAEAKQQEARERADEEQAQQDVEQSVEREADAKEETNPDAHRDEPPFSS